MVPNAVAAPCGETRVIVLPTRRPNLVARPTPTATASSPRKSSSDPTRTLWATAPMRLRSSWRMPRTSAPADWPPSAESSTWPSTTGVVETTPGTARMRAAVASKSVSGAPAA